MGLDVVATNDAGEECETHHTYRSYGRFREMVVEAVSGHPRSSPYGPDPTTMVVLRAFGHVIPDPAQTTQQNPTLLLFMNHSDCRGGFTQEEAARLHAMFSAHKDAFYALASEEMKNSFDEFVCVLGVGSKPGGKIVYQ